MVSEMKAGCDCMRREPERVKERKREIMVWLCHYKGCWHGGVQCLMNNGCSLKQPISYSFFQGCGRELCVIIVSALQRFQRVFRNVTRCWMCWNNSNKKKFTHRHNGLIQKSLLVPNKYRTTDLTRRHLLVQPLHTDTSQLRFIHSVLSAPRLLANTSIPGTCNYGKCVDPHHKGLQRQWQALVQYVPCLFLCWAKKGRVE